MIPIGETHDGRADMTNFEMDLFDTRMHSTMKTVKDEDVGPCCGGSSSRGKGVVKPACLPITILSVLIITLVFLPLFNDQDLEAPDKAALPSVCREGCSLRLVESIPTGVSFPGSVPHDPTWQAWLEIINGAQGYLDIAALYWNLNEGGFPTSDKGRAVFEALIAAGKRGVKIRIAQSISGDLSNNTDSAYLAEHGAQVRNVNMSALVGSGVLHTKFIIADMRTVYVGSANMDWKSLTEVKELGVVASNCSCIAGDLYRIFAVYWRLGEEGAKIPAKWPISYRTQFNLANPMPLPMDGDPDASLFISSCPGPFNPKGREHDLAAIVGLIGEAKSSVSVAVMDFLPMTLYMKGDDGKTDNKFWPHLDNALRDAAFRGVSVRLLVSNWNHTRSATIPFLKSMLAINEGLPMRKGSRGSIDVRIFTVPSDEEQKKIPFARVNHNKYMVADNVAYIGTSNWAGDYFISTAGVGLAIKSTRMATQLQSVFDRDWNSSYSKGIERRRR